MSVIYIGIALHEAEIGDQIRILRGGYQPCISPDYAHNQTTEFPTAQLEMLTSRASWPDNYLYNPNHSSKCLYWSYLATLVTSSERDFGGRSNPPKYRQEGFRIVDLQ